LIDFGISKKYLNPDGTHIRFGNDVAFNGNLMFSSPNALKNCGMVVLLIHLEQSRRDDLISLSFLMSYLLTGD
jgi:hypothetical protein